MATGIPDYYLGGTPESTQGLSPLQLALAEILRKGSETSLFVNQEFMTEMKRFADSTPIVPLDVITTNTQTFTNVYNYLGEISIDYWVPWNQTNVQLTPAAAALINQIARITSVRVITIGDQIYLQRIAQDCGPNEAVRYELVEVGKRSEIAEGAFAVYGKVLYGGPAASGSVGYGYTDGPV